ncbi:unnamed protein product [Linum trigynum]|uniref:Uncharacterized protein n=1 Tax=Linum trigynum TaxID=586398 RepID=A0AAV2F6U9_9ROSI
MNRNRRSDRDQQGNRGGRGRGRNHPDEPIESPIQLDWCDIMLLDLEARELLTRLSSLPFGESRCLDWDTVCAVRVSNSIHDMLGNGAWRVVFDFNEIIYRELTLEFLASFTLTKDGLKQFSFPNGITFRLGGQLHTMSLTQFSITMGLYSEHFFQGPLYSQLKTKRSLAPHADLDQCWFDTLTRVVVGMPFDQRTTKASMLHHDFPLLYNVLSHGLLPLRGSPGAISNRHLAILTSLACFRPIHAGHSLVLTLHNINTRSNISVVHGGAFVTRLARRLGLDPVAMGCTPVGRTIPLSLDHWQAMKRLDPPFAYFNEDGRYDAPLPEVHQAEPPPAPPRAARAREPRPPPPGMSFGHLDARLDHIESIQELVLQRLGISYVPFGHSSGASTSSGRPSDTRSQEDGACQPAEGDYPGSD